MTEKHPRIRVTAVEVLIEKECRMTDLPMKTPKKVLRASLPSIQEAYREFR